MITIDMPATGKRINTLRKAAGLRVSDLQAVCGFATPQAIFKWLRGDTLPTLDNCCIIAAALNVTLDDLIVVRQS